MHRMNVKGGTKNHIVLDDFFFAIYLCIYICIDSVTLWHRSTS